MKNKYIVILLSFCFIITSCQIREKTGFPVDRKLSVDMKGAVSEPLFQDVDFIPLETHENSFVSFINKIVVYKDTIVVHSMRDKYVAFFSKEGEFLYRFPVGEGPGELLYPADIAIDKEAGTLWVLDRYRSMKEYDFRGTFLREVVSVQPYLRMDRYKDVLMLFESYMNRDNPLLFKFIIDNEEQEELYFIDKDPRFAKLPYIQTTAFCPVNDSICYFYHQYDDCIYAWNYNNKEVSVGVDISYINGKSIKKGWDKDQDQDLEANVYQDFYNNREFIFGIKNLYHYDNNLFFTVEDKSMHYCLYDLLNGKFIMSHHFAVGMPNIRTEFFQADDDSILFVLTPEQIEEFIEDKAIPVKSGKLIELSKNLQIDDNPVIVVAKVRL